MNWNALAEESSFHKRLRLTVFVTGKFGALSLFGVMCRFGHFGGAALLWAFLLQYLIYPAADPVRSVEGVFARALVNARARRPASTNAILAGGRPPTPKRPPLERLISRIEKNAKSS